MTEIVNLRTGELVDPKQATAEQLRSFAVAVRERIPLLTDDELNMLEALLVAVAKRLKQLGKDASEAERSRVMALRRIGEMLGPAARGGDRRSEGFKSEKDDLKPAEKNRRHRARLLAEFAELVDAELAKDKPISLSRMVKICQRKRSAREVAMPESVNREGVA